MGAHGRHGKIRTQTEEADAQNQKHRTGTEGDQFRGGQVKQRCQRENIYNCRNGQCGN